MADARAVAALNAFFQAMTDHGGRLRSWQLGTDPCGAPNCGGHAPAALPAAAQGSVGNPMMLIGAHEAPSAMAPCAWDGITCSNWRVEELVLPCSTAGEQAAVGLLGQLPDYMGNLDALTVLDLQVCLFRRPYLPPIVSSSTVRVPSNCVRICLFALLYMHDRSGHANDRAWAARAAESTQRDCAGRPGAHERAAGAAPGLQQAEGQPARGLGAADAAADPGPALQRAHRRAAHGELTCFGWRPPCLHTSPEVARA